MSLREMLKSFWMLTVSILGEERGEFSAEELAILGDDPTPEPEPDPEPGDPEPEPEPEPEPDPGEPEPEPEPGEPDSVQKRINELTASSKEAERKLNIFKTLGAEEYYKLYPDEKPADADPIKKPIPEDANNRVLTFSEAQGLQIQGGEYNGKTLGELWKSGDKALEAEAIDIYNRYRDDQIKAINDKQATEIKAKEDLNQEANDMALSLAKEYFGSDKRAIDSVDKLTPDERTKLDAVFDSLIEYMRSTGKQLYKMQDAYALMKMDDLIANAKTAGAKALIQGMKKESVKTISSKKGSEGADTGYAAYEKLSESQLADRIGKMSDAQYQKFLKDAPQSMKDKFPGVDWG